MRKLFGMKGYRLTLTFIIASAFFVATYVLTVDRVVIAAVFVVLLATVMLVDTRVQRYRNGSVRALETSLPEREWDGSSYQATVLADPEAAQPEAPTPARPVSQLADLPTIEHAGEAQRVSEPTDRQDAPGPQDSSPPATAEAPVPAVNHQDSASLGYDAWLRVLRGEYLQDFVKNAGAAVKFVIPQEHSQHESFWSELQKAAEENDYLFVSVDAATTRIQMIDELFHEIARQIEWDELALDFLRKTLSEGQYLVPPERDQFNLSQIASMNGLDLGEMRAVINNRLRDNLSRYFEITDDFRMAMLKLCQAQLDPHDLGVGGAEAVREWLRGDLKLISALKPASIFEKINRSNGRDMVSSLAHWLHLTGKSGLVLGLDISRFLVAKRHGQPDGSIYYSSASVLDGYEVLRQFIDSTDELQYCVIVVSAPPTFLTDEQRGVRKYDALYLRIWDEVHDRQTVNPLSTLVRLSGQEKAAPQRV